MEATKPTLIVLDSPTVCGADEEAEKLAQDFESQGYKVTVFNPFKTPEFKGSRNMLLVGGRQFGVRTAHIVGVCYRFKKAFEQHLNKLLKENDFVIVSGWLIALKMMLFKMRDLGMLIDSQIEDLEIGLKEPDFIFSITPNNFKDQMSNNLIISYSIFAKQNGKRILWPKQKKAEYYLKNLATTV